jgi:hypothetical protein
MSFYYLISSDEYRRNILSFLWFQDIFRVGSSYKDALRFILDSDPVLSHELLNHVCGLTGRNITYNFRHDLNMFKATRFAATLSTWPTEMSLAHHEIPSRNKYQIVETKTSAGESCFVFQGKICGKNRTVVGNDHYPVTAPTVHCSPIPARPLSSLPFAKIAFDTVSQESIPLQSCVVYYEISVLPVMPPPSLLDSEGGLTSPLSSNYQSPCIAIGIARPGFDIYRSMPGWDYLSYGFHGDDGLFFCGDSEHGFRPISNILLNKFAAGDTVGLGLVYPYRKESRLSRKATSFVPLRSDMSENDDEENEEEEDHHNNNNNGREGDMTSDSERKEFGGAIFFTKNGVLQSVLTISDKHFFEHCWFPAVGTDSYNPIQVNLGTGEKPFRFDLDAFERKDHEESQLPILPELKKSESYKKTVKRLKHQQEELDENKKKTNSNKRDYEGFQFPTYFHPLFSGELYPTPKWRALRNIRKDHSKQQFQRNRKNIHDQNSTSNEMTSQTSSSMDPQSPSSAFYYGIETYTVTGHLLRSLLTDQTSDGTGTIILLLIS